MDAVMRGQLPDDTLVSDRTGKVLLADIQRPGVQHSDVRLRAMGRWLPAAVVAADDPRFWTDPGRIAGAAWDGVRGGQGGDTGPRSSPA